MSATLSGGKLAAQTNKIRYGSDFYARLGRKGGSRKVPKSFSFDRERASKAGQIGGRISKRPKSEKGGSDAKDGIKYETVRRQRDTKLYIPKRHGLHQDPLFAKKTVLAAGDTPKHQHRWFSRLMAALRKSADKNGEDMK